MRLFLILLALAVGPLQTVQADVIADNPHLKKYLFEEPDAHLQFGFGVSPVRIMKNKAGVTLSIFQLHWSYGPYDLELFNASYGTTVSGDANSKVDSFTFRTCPKYRLTQAISIGPLLGVEFVSFPDQTARLNKNNFFTPVEPFSSKGFIFGGAVSQTFKLGSKFTFKMNQTVYKQTYDTNGTTEGWQYFYSDNNLNADSSPIGPGAVFLFEFSLLY